MNKTTLLRICGGFFLMSTLYATLGAQVPAVPPAPDAPGAPAPGAPAPGAPAPGAPAAPAAAGRSANEGVFTAGQAMRGDALYKEQCATCHGDNLEGSGPMPPLAGKDFLANWTGKSVGDLFEKTHTTMPATAPGTLTPAQAADIVAYLLYVGKYPAGTTELDSKLEPLMQIKLEAPREVVAQ